MAANQDTTDGAKVIGYPYFRVDLDAPGTDTFTFCPVCDDRLGPHPLAEGEGYERDEAGRLYMVDPTKYDPSTEINHVIDEHPDTAAQYGLTEADKTEPGDVYHEGHYLVRRTA